MNPKFKMLGTLKFEGKTYSIVDNKGMVKPETLGLNNFYGGRVKHLAVVDKTKTKGIYLCIEGSAAIDIIQFDVAAVKGNLPARDNKKSEVISKEKKEAVKEAEDDEDDPFLEEDADEDDESEDDDPELDDEEDDGDEDADEEDGDDGDDQSDDGDADAEDEGADKPVAPATQGSTLPRKSRPAKRSNKK